MVTVSSCSRTATTPHTRMSSSEGYARQRQRGRIDVDAGIDLDPCLACSLDGADQDVFRLGGRRRAASGSAVQHRLQLTLFDTVEILSCLLDPTRWDAAIAR